MRYIKIEKNFNGSHSNQTGGLITDKNWVELSENIILPNVFPFVDIVFENGKVTQLLPQTIQAEDFVDISAEDYEGWKAKIDFFFKKEQITEEEHDNLISALNEAIGRE